MNTSPVRHLLTIVVVLLFTSTYVVSYDDGAVSVTISNRTRHFLHVSINNLTFAYVAPGGNAYTEITVSTAFVEVFYSPGQGIHGRAVKELTSTTTHTYDRDYDSGCNENQSGGGCDTYQSTSVETGVTRSPVSWAVTADELQADTPPSSGK